jgi:Zn-dependent M32 family carboxypeptidase
MILKASEEAMTAALINELCSGRQFLDSLQKYREHDAAELAKESRKHAPKKNWRHLAEIPQREYLQMAQKYGHECWEDRDFVKDFQKYEPELAVHKL